MKSQNFGKLALAGILAGGFAAFTACKDSTSSQDSGNGPTDILSAKTSTAFKTACDSLHGTFMAHNCDAKNTCHGYSFNDSTMKVVEHGCNGMGSSKGANCQTP